MTDAAEALDAAILRAERRVRLLQERAKIAMDLMRRLHREALDEPAKLSSGDLVDAFVRLSHAVRLIIALEARADEALRRLRDRAESERKAHRVEAGASAVRSRAASHRLQ